LERGRKKRIKKKKKKKKEKCFPVAGSHSAQASGAVLYYEKLI
jgi:hypothetical protein